MRLSRRFIKVLERLLGPDHDVYINFLDVAEVADAFAAKHDEAYVNYVTFCTQLQATLDDDRDEDDGKKADSSSASERNATTSEASSAPRRHRRKRKSKPDITKRAIRVDPRLEKHRVLKSSIRHKVLHGAKHMATSKDGFDGLRDVLCQADTNGTGFLSEAIFVETLLEHMQAPLTAKEMGYLTTNLRHRKRPDAIDYEQIGLFLCVDSEEEASTSGDDNGRRRRQSLDAPHLGSDILSLERDLRARLLQRLPLTAENALANCSHTRRSIFTGAEKFVEACEVFDPLCTNALTEEGYAKALDYIHFTVSTSQLQAILTKFPREPSSGGVSYVVFLERYGQRYATVKQQTHMKTLVTRLATDPSRDLGPTLLHFKKQLAKFDKRVTGVCAGVVTKTDFASALTTHETYQWPSKEVQMLAPLFADGPHIQYPHFLTMVEDCTAMMPGVPCDCRQSAPSATSALETRLRRFLVDKSRGTSGYDTALHAFESADALRNPKTAPTGLLHEQDFCTVLRTIGTGLSPADRAHILQLLSTIHALTPNGVLYRTFLTHLKTETSFSSDDASSRNVPSHLRNICVATYLKEYATAGERSNFEKVLAALSSLPSPRKGDVTTDQNNLVFALGPLLKVKVQFFT
ncbi:hypothetical protein SPRG_20097 [Saprolegnia parasitica CBS 223.65]|uniref:EF-hand domain-containing protein n=1 Tax=Saprolegnia parasitica (strain CBS 223.65) TaxID=695850 RepID=A0A067CR20_SAPPC|nr:hypothetical protein SPRG_20097 [Saprolegnia parasitica CBS 223.65]KDO28991.1 hypothetical protein SPRG_20097 [Saprolegnia parasitica CBS 223.65]|eukprot:XP_012200323.1 hypothetical protein SPRG_20097 [Saprolegnia parasitica CBS 223.65]